MSPIDVMVWAVSLAVAAIAAVAVLLCVRVILDILGDFL